MGGGQSSTASQSAPSRRTQQSILQQQMSMQRSQYPNRSEMGLQQQQHSYNSHLMSQTSMVNHSGFNAPVPLKPPSGVKVIQNDIILKKKTAKITQIKGSNDFQFQFEFDALNPVIITAVFFAHQKTQFFTQLHDGFIGARAQTITQANDCAKGQNFTAPLPVGVGEYENQLFEADKQGFWPIIVKIERVGEVEPKSIYSYFVIDHINKKDFVPILRKQTLELNMESYEIQEIYGVENTDLINGEAAEHSQKQANMDDCSKECIICMTDLIDTAIMPCRHMCICLECAKMIQKKKQQGHCPVCRKEIESFLRISKAPQIADTQIKP